MTIARGRRGEEKSRSAFSHIGDRDSSDGPPSVILLSLPSEAVLQRLSCNSSLIHAPPTAPDILVGFFLFFIFLLTVKLHLSDADLTLPRRSTYRTFLRLSLIAIGSPKDQRGPVELRYEQSRRKDGCACVCCFDVRWQRGCSVQREMNCD